MRKCARIFYNFFLNYLRMSFFCSTFAPILPYYGLKHKINDKNIEKIQIMEYALRLGSVCYCGRKYSIKIR